MAKVEIPYQPALTAAQAMTIFAERFRGKYEVCKTRLFKRDFMVKKNWSTAVSVALRQEPGATKFIMTGCQGSGLITLAEFLAGILLMEVIAIGVFGVVLAGGILFWAIGACLAFAVDWILFGSGRKAMEREVRAFVEGPSELWGGKYSARPDEVSRASGLSEPAICSACGAGLGENARFCQSCGAPAPILEAQRRPSCTACGAVLGENARFCQVCGAAVPLPEPEPLPSASPPLQEGTYCTRCGTLVPQSSLFCHKCGAEVAPAQRNGAQTSAAGSKPAPRAPLKRGYCDLCRQELGVNEKMMGLTAHEVCPMPVSEAPAPATAPATDAVETAASVPAVPPAPDADEGSSSIRRGYCDVCGQELGVNEKMMGLTAHEMCPASDGTESTA